LQVSLLVFFYWQSAYLYIHEIGLFRLRRHLLFGAAGAFGSADIPDPPPLFVCVCFPAFGVLSDWFIFWSTIPRRARRGSNTGMNPPPPPPRPAVLHIFSCWSHTLSSDTRRSSDAPAGMCPFPLLFFQQLSMWRICLLFAVCQLRRFDFIVSLLFFPFFCNYLRFPCVSPSYTTVSWSFFTGLRDAKFFWVSLPCKGAPGDHFLSVLFFLVPDPQLRFLHLGQTRAY